MRDVPDPPRMSPVVLRLRGETLGGNGLPRAICARGRYEPYDWRIATSSRVGALELRIRRLAHSTT